MRETKNPEITHYQKLGNLTQVYHLRGFPGHLDSKESATMGETWVRSMGWEDPLEKGKATHSSVLACRIPWTV